MLKDGTLEKLDGFAARFPERADGARRVLDVFPACPVSVPSLRIGNAIIRACGADALDGVRFGTALRIVRGVLGVKRGADVSEVVAGIGAHADAVAVAVADHARTVAARRAARNAARNGAARVSKRDMLDALLDAEGF